MTPVLLAAAPAGAATNNPVLNISIFGAFVAVTLFIVIRASRNNKTAAPKSAGVLRGG